MVLKVIINGISLEERQVVRVLEAEILCRREVNEMETRRNVVAEVSAVVLSSFLGARAALSFPSSAVCCTKTKEKIWFKPQLPLCLFLGKWVAASGHLSWRGSAHNLFSKQCISSNQRYFSGMIISKTFFLKDSYDLMRNLIFLNKNRICEYTCLGFS